MIRIPVVVHILWNTPGQDFTDAQVQQQIDAMTADFRLTNSDAINIPPHFAPFAADTRIEFALARRDPQCNATTGIERRFTPKTSFVQADQGIIKSTSAGGLDAWPPSRYLNIWVANAVDGIIGYAYLPAAAASVGGWDGVFVATGVFGVIQAHHPHHLGRIATHEAGHWLDLLHVWGSPDCSGGDQCPDTPPQAGPTYGPPAGSTPTSCGNGPNGNMYQNHLDYTDEQYKCMFTADQALRMDAALRIERHSLFWSDGLIPPHPSSAPDLWMQSCFDDIGDEPYTGPGSICSSDDIWIRNGFDGSQGHQNPKANHANTINVRVRNRACPGGAPQTGTLRVYWAKASPSLAWPAPWDGSVTVPALMGEQLFNGFALNVPPGGQQTVMIPWFPPDPSDYASFFADAAHFCLLARIETTPTYPFGMTFPETGSLDANVRNNNNIAWKNVSVVDMDGPLMFSDVVIGRFDPDRKVGRYTFDVPKAPGPTLFDWGFVIVEARGEALEGWRQPKLRGEGFQRLDDGRLLIARPGAWIAAPPMKQGEFGTLRLRFVPNVGAAIGARVLELQLAERDPRGRFLGGQNFLLKTGRFSPPPCRGGDDGYDGVDWLPMQARCGC